jgi:hypothetical protein
MEFGDDAPYKRDRRRQPGRGDAACLSGTKRNVPALAIRYDSLPRSRPVILRGKNITKTIQLVATLLIVGIYGSRVPAQTTSGKPTADHQDIANALSNVRALKTKSYHHFLREAAKILPPTCVGRDWSNITSLLAQRECPLVESWNNGNRRYHLVQKDVFSFPRGQSLDAFLWLSSDSDIPARFQADSRRVFEANIVLAANFNVAYQDLIDRDPFPRGSVLDVVLRSQDVQREGSRWPLVKTVFVQYGTSIYRGGSVSGFDVTVELTASAEKKIGSKKMDFFVRSGLDPRDSLGEIAGQGGNEWWHGDAAVIEANKRKYLNAATPLAD